MMLITAGVIYFSRAICGADLLDTILSFSIIRSKSHHHTKLPIDNQLHHLPTGDSYLHTSVVQFFDFVNNLRFQVLRKISESKNLPVLDFSKLSESKNLGFWVFENSQNQSTYSFRFLKNFKEPLVLGF
jgi:hypothetical protein